MTLQEAKDQVAKRHRFNDWEDVVLQFQAKNHVDEVAELYARSKWDEASVYYIENFDGNLPPKPEFNP